MRHLFATLLLVAACGTTKSPAGGEVKVGSKAPDFTLTSSDGQPVALSGLLAKGPVILAFFPKAFTGG